MVEIAAKVGRVRVQVWMTRVSGRTLPARHLPHHLAPERNTTLCGRLDDDVYVLDRMIGDMGYCASKIQNLVPECLTGRGSACTSDI